MQHLTMTQTVMLLCITAD